MSEEHLHPRILDKLKELGIPSRSLVLHFTASIAAGGGAGESHLIVARKEILLFSALPLDDPELVDQENIVDVARIRTFRSILDALVLHFEDAADNTILEFQVPGLQREEWEPLQESLTKAFGKKYEPLSEESGFCKAVMGTGIADGPLIEFKAFTMPSSLSSMGEQALDITVIDEGAGGTGETPFSLPPISIDPPPPPVEHPQQPATGRFARPKPTAEAPGRAPEETPGPEDKIKCPKCSRLNAPTYIYCLGCGSQLRKPAPGEKKARPLIKGGVIHSTTTSSSSQPEEGGVLSGCITQVFWVVLAIVALLFLDSLSK